MPCSPTLTAYLITSAARLITGARALWLGCTPLPAAPVLRQPQQPRRLRAAVGSLPQALRKRTRPVAGADYWAKPGIRDFHQPGVQRRIDRPPTQAKAAAARYSSIPGARRLADLLPGRHA